ncbi:MAG: hypothetical protein U1E39_09135 [Planctomycetota bacterium]
MPPGTCPAPLRDPGRARALGGLLVVLAMAFGALVHAGTATLSPTARDQVHDLSLALRIRDGEALSDGNRHPLFPALLAPVARRSPGFFDDACLVASVVAALAWLAVGGAAASVAGAATGLVAALAVVLEFRLQARRVCPEPLLAGLLAIAAARAATAAAASRPLRALAAAGGWLGLAWLTKGSALLSLGATLAVVVATGGPGRARRAAAVFVGFVLVASPLLAWNVAHGRSPVFNVNSAHVMWEDAWDVELDARSTATPASYLDAHGVAGAVARLGRGLATQRGLEWVAGALAVVAVGAYLRRRRGGGAVDGGRPEARRAFVRLATVSAVVWGLAMAWYAPVVASRRLLFPIFPVLATAAAIVVGDVLRGSAGPAARAARRAADLVAVAAPALAAIVLGAVLFGAGGATPSAPRPTLDPASLEAAAALRALPAGTRVVVRPSRTAPPDWLYDDVVEPVGLPASVRGDDLAAWLPANADAVLVGDGFFRNRSDVVPGLRARADGTFEFAGPERGGLPTGDVRAAAPSTFLAGGAYVLLRWR